MYSRFDPRPLLRTLKMKLILLDLLAFKQYPSVSMNSALFVLVNISGMGLVFFLKSYECEARHFSSVGF
jgi:hypothetical protein